MLAHSILSHAKFYLKFHGQNNFRVLLPKNKLGETLREYYSLKTQEPSDSGAKDDMVSNIMKYHITQDKPQFNKT